MTKFPINLFNIAGRRKEDRHLPNTIIFVVLEDPNSYRKLSELMLYSHELINLSVYKLLEGNPLSAGLLISNIVQFIDSLFSHSLEVRRVSIYCTDDSDGYIYSIYDAGRTSKDWLSSVIKKGVRKLYYTSDESYLYRIIRSMTRDNRGNHYYTVDLSSYAINKIFNNVL